MMILKILHRAGTLTYMQDDLPPYTLGQAPCHLPCSIWCWTKVSNLPCRFDFGLAQSDTKTVNILIGLVGRQALIQPRGVHWPMASCEEGGLPLDWSEITGRLTHNGPTHCEMTQQSLSRQIGGSLSWNRYISQISDLLMNLAHPYIMCSKTEIL